MCPVEKVRMASCQISFAPIAREDYMADIERVLDIIKDSGLEHNVGLLSTVVIGKNSRVLGLVSSIYEAMDGVCSFAEDVKLANLCGCECS